MTTNLDRLRWIFRQGFFVGLCYLCAACTAGLVEWRLEPSAAVSSQNTTTNVSVVSTRPVTFGLANLSNLQFLLSTTAPPVVENATVVNVSVGPARPGQPRPAAVPVAPIPVRLEAPKLTGTLAGSGHSLAVFQVGNETHILGIGEEVNGYKVLEVSQYEARVRDSQGQSFNLTMGLAQTSGVAPPPPPPINTTVTNTTVAANTTAVADGTFSTRELRQMLDHTSDYAATMNVHAVRRGDDVAGYQINYTAGNNPFAKLGIQNGDLLVSFQNRALKGPEDLQWAYNELRNATSLSFRVERAGRVLPLNVQLTD